MLHTKLLFDENPYLEKFEATVLSCEETEKGFWVVLDSTAFFPEGGGQFPDEGTLNGEKVLDVQEDNEGVIRHLVQKTFYAEEKIIGQIDMARRFDFMQQHSGEHIFPALPIQNTVQPTWVFTLDLRKQP
ncbi:MAG: hypothetical protein IJD08_03380 [Oscillospiraceae bacterium]|nr:hypothetical protein [Oscillospiraceae bacterium]